MELPKNITLKWIFELNVEKTQDIILEIIKKNCDKPAQKHERLDKDIVYYPVRTNDPKKCDRSDRYLRIVIRKVNNTKSSVQLIFEGNRLVHTRKPYPKNMTIIDFTAFKDDVIQYPASEDPLMNKPILDWRYKYYSEIYNKVKTEIDVITRPV